MRLTDATFVEMSLYPDPRRVVTGHDKAGNSIVVADTRIPSLPVPIDCNFAVLYETHEFPALNDNWNDPTLKKTGSLANNAGIILRCVDFKPRTKTVRKLDPSLASRKTSADFRRLIWHGDSAVIPSY